MKHSSGTDRNVFGPIDMGAFEYNTALSISEREDPKVRLFPNPASTTLQVETENFESIDIYASSGEFILESNRHITDISRLPRGFYLIKITHGGEVSSRRFVKH